MLWVHEEPVTKAKRTTDTTGAVSTLTEMDPWGGETNRSYWSALQPHRYTSYERDANGGDEAMHRRYNRLSKFDQPDPYDGSYDLTNPQSFNRYSYVQNDPVNFVDPTGLAMSLACVAIYGIEGQVLRADCTYDAPDRYLYGFIGYTPRDPNIFEPTAPPSVPDGWFNKHLCDYLRKEIEKLTATVRSRWRAQTRNRGNLPATGRNSLAGHQQQFKQEQIRLQKRIDQFNSNGCGDDGGLPPGADEWANKPDPIPRIPAPPIPFALPRGGFPNGPLPLPAIPLPVLPIMPALPLCIILGTCDKQDYGPI